MDLEYICREGCGTYCIDQMEKMDDGTLVCACCGSSLYTIREKDMER